MKYIRNMPSFQFTTGKLPIQLTDQQITKITMLVEDNVVLEKLFQSDDFRIGVYYLLTGQIQPTKHPNNLLVQLLRRFGYTGKYIRNEREL